MSTDRRPLLSDKKLRGYEGEPTIVKMLNNVSMSNYAVRQFYEDLIDKGELFTKAQVRKMYEDDNMEPPKALME